MGNESKKLIHWLQEVGADQEVLRLFMDGRLDDAVDKAAKDHPDISDDDKKLMKEKNNLEKICKKLEEEQEELRSGPGAAHMFWVLVRV